VIAYADTSAIARAYMPDEPGHERVRRALFDERWTVLTSVLAVCDRHPLRALDALHLAVALVDGARVAGDAPLAFLTCDARQAGAARACGLELLPEA